MIRRYVTVAVDPTLLRDIAVSDTARWQVLHRTEAGRLNQAVPGDVWVDRGRRLAPHLQPTVRLLLDEELVAIIDEQSTRRLTLTDAGALRLAALTDQRARAKAARRCAPRPAQPEPTPPADGRRGGRMSLVWFGSVVVLALITAVRIAATFRRSGGAR